MTTPFGKISAAPVPPGVQRASPPLGAMLSAVVLFAATIAALVPGAHADDRTTEQVWVDHFDALTAAFVAEHPRGHGRATAVIVGLSSAACAIGPNGPPLFVAGAPPIDPLPLYRPEIVWDVVPLLARAAAIETDHVVIDEDALFVVSDRVRRSAREVQSIAFQLRLPGRPFTYASAKGLIDDYFRDDGLCLPIRLEQSAVECDTGCIVQPSEDAIHRVIAIAQRGTDVVTITVPNRRGASRLSDDASRAARDAMRARLAAAGVPHFDAPQLGDDAYYNTEHMNESGRARTQAWLAQLLTSRAR